MVSTPQITVIDPSLRRVTVKVTAGTYLSDVRDEACSKLRLDSSQYMLKRNDKQIDLSVTFRLSGLPPGCKLELIQRSKSPSVITVALQVPEGLKTGDPASASTRLVGKFSSLTSLWQILRAFESGNVDGSDRTWNFTEQAKGGATSGDGHYYQPAIHVMGRDYTGIEALQKSLDQLGFHDGNVLLTLRLILTEKSLLDAKKEMERYFSEAEPQRDPSDSASTPADSLSTNEPTSSTISQQSSPSTLPTNIQPDPEPSTTPSTITSRPTTVFRPPTSSAPRASLLEANDSDFEPSVDLMKQHQATIQSQTRNKRLPTDAEMAAAAEESAAKLAAVRTIDIKIVFPDQSSVLAPFTHNDTAQDLYAYVRDLLARPQESFALNHAGGKGPVPLWESQEKLIADLHFVGRVLVRVSWAADVGLEARQGPSLKDSAVRIAKEIETVTIAGDDTQQSSSKGVSNDGKEPTKSGGGSTSKVPKWLKLPGKK